ncbi:TauD/TfdA family dioxygenase [Thermopetrobacter sp. TC1]|uniref:TauD/TfdA family dioxygenase n=1 Tax=Thermopetrobacter sp. TC1 TaxID=1495045 RepID=UPI000691FAC2|nr:TauD/TfdA family dioxygenase [Thermopetrobacter sp. TC1]
MTDTNIDRNAEMPKIPQTGPFSLSDEEAYRAWRQAKLAAHPKSPQEMIVPVSDLENPSPQEKARIIDLCRRANMAIYDTQDRSGEAGPALERALRHFAAHFGMTDLEEHRSMDEEQVVAIEVVDENERPRHGFIPYTTRRILWHTDGYYKYGWPGAPVIRSMILHCARQAKSGGENELLDYEIAYIRLRDENPGYIEALMAPDAMTIPEFREEDGSIRPESRGPVFWVDEDTGALQMRYTERSRHIIWKDDPLTLEAVEFLRHLLRSDEEPFLFRVRMQPGQGLVCNNVLHTRTAFEDWDEPGRGRLMYRARYSNRILNTGLLEAA